MENKWTVRTTDFKKCELHATVIPCTRSKVSRKAVKTLLALWGVAFLCVLVPLLHFVLVPVALIAGLFYGYRVLGYKNQILFGTFLCPECEKTNSIKNLWLADELRSRCEHCGTQLVYEVEHAQT